MSSYERVAKCRAVKRAMRRYETDESILIPPSECGHTADKRETFDTSESPSSSDTDFHSSGSDVVTGDSHDNVNYGDSGNDIASNPQQELAHWAARNNISHKALDELLAMKIFSIHLPRDSRTLLKSNALQGKVARHTIDNSKGVGNYCYYGLENGLVNFFKTNGIKFSHETCFKLSFNVDGLPLFKSSSHQFWPILCKVVGYDFDPFVVSLYEGKSKPSSPSEFLEPFIAELKGLLLSGIKIGEEVHGVSVHAFICDAPARAYLKCIKGHTGYHGCERCVSAGEIKNNRMVFISVDEELRNDDCFRSGVYEAHHTGRSPLAAIESFGLVSQFPLDYMHLVCLGVMRKLLCLWVSGPNRVRLGPRCRVAISERHCSLAKWTPSEFNRLPRGLDTIERWKATEFRTFLLYSGPIALKNVLPVHLYNHFLILHVAVRILCSPKMALPLSDYAAGLLKSFVSAMGEHYGSDTLVYNVHSLIHLPSDVKSLQAPLDSFSCFPFENYLGKLKKLIRTPRNPLEQITRRLAEFNSLPNLTRKERDFYVKKARDASRGELSEIIVKGIKFSCKDTRDSYVMVGMKCFKILGIHSELESDGEVDKNSLMFKGRYFKYSEDYFKYPCNSSSMNIFKVWGFSSKRSEIKYSDEVVKCYIMPEKDFYVAFPEIS